MQTGAGWAHTGTLRPGHTCASLPWGSVAAPPGFKTPSSSRLSFSTCSVKVPNQGRNTLCLRWLICVLKQTYFSNVACGQMKLPSRLVWATGLVCAGEKTRSVSCPARRWPSLLTPQSVPWEAVVTYATRPSPQAWTTGHDGASPEPFLLDGSAALPPEPSRQTVSGSVICGWSVMWHRFLSSPGEVVPSEKANFCLCLCVCVCVAVCLCTIV